MKVPTPKFNLSRSVIGTLFVFFGLMGAVSSAAGKKDYPNLDTILDPGMFFLSGILALLLRDMGGRINRPLPKHRAACFTMSSRQNNESRTRNGFRSQGKKYSLGKLL
jgi:hypothetical protein